MQTHQNPLVLLNYKAYHTLEDTRGHIEKILKQEKDNSLSLCISVPYTFFKPLQEYFADRVTFGSDHMQPVKDNSFTASVAARLINDAEMKFTLIGSSYERLKKGTDDPEINQKLLNALHAGIHPILCLCDTQQEFAENQSTSIMSQQLSAALTNLPPEQLKGLHILYDAPWINNTPWHAGDETLLKAYQNFNTALSETLTPENIVSMHLLYAVPAFSPDLPEIVNALPAAGYSLGMLIAKDTLDVCRLPVFTAVSDSKEPFADPVPAVTSKEDEHLENLRSRMPDAETPILMETVSSEEKTSAETPAAAAIQEVMPILFTPETTPAIAPESAPFKVVTEEESLPTAAKEVIDQITEETTVSVSDDDEPASPTIWEEFPVASPKKTKKTETPADLNTNELPKKPAKSKTTRRVSPLTDFVSDAEFDL